MHNFELIIYHLQTPKELFIFVGFSEHCICYKQHLQKTIQVLH